MSNGKGSMIFKVKSWLEGLRASNINVSAIVLSVNEQGYDFKLDTYLIKYLKYRYTYSRNYGLKSSVF